VKVLEEARRRGYVCQGLLMWGRALSARQTEQDPRTQTPRLLLHSHSPQAQPLAQGLEGDILALDLHRQGENATRRIGMRGCFEDRADVVLVESLCSEGHPPRSIGVSDLGCSQCLRAVWDVDIDEILGVECVDLALTGSHNGWGEDGEVRVLQWPCYTSLRYGA
ncbi:hypothetical protein POSPLADRAFT_1153585, partial [Postia placenta MAD-698-R-SB12]